MFRTFFLVCLFSSLLLSKTITAKETVACCPTRLETSDIYSVRAVSSSSFKIYMYQHECTMIRRGDTVKVAEDDHTMVKIKNFYGEFWCPSEIR